MSHELTSNHGAASPLFSFYLFCVQLTGTRTQFDCKHCHSMRIPLCEQRSHIMQRRSQSQSAYFRKKIVTLLVEGYLSTQQTRVVTAPPITTRTNRESECSTTHLSHLEVHRYHCYASQALAFKRS
ncbi:hypothetical protein [Rubritalea tangerina]|uniref:hypothetical protein n=1 Tax=Rubritalea tangerina TaxID=430798 RepID=UPI00361B1498